MYQADIPSGIILEGERSPGVIQLSEALAELGLFRIPSGGTGDTLTKELIDSLNCYRSVNRLPELDFCDPVTLRSLGIECSGDDIMLLARYGEGIGKTELECYDLCREAVSEAKRLGMSICGYIGTRCQIGKLPAAVSEAAVTAALIASVG